LIPAAASLLLMLVRHSVLPVPMQDCLLVLKLVYHCLSLLQLVQHCLQRVLAQRSLLMR
jgi:hypothetical protein